MTLSGHLHNTRGPAKRRITCDTLPSRITFSVVNGPKERNLILSHIWSTGVLVLEGIEVFLSLYYHYFFVKVYPVRSCGSHILILKKEWKSKFYLARGVSASAYYVLNKLSCAS